MEVAADLAKNSRPGYVRSTVSRAYYAAYHVLYETQLKLGGTKTASHDVVSDRFITSPVMEVIALGEKLQDLKQRRHRADYRLKDKDIEKPIHTEIALADAHWLITTVSLYLSNPMREKMREAIIARDRLRRGL